ncbi:MAG TPA: serine hydrolase, partial [Candidatus Omnitrophota bacterium]|nr:serine hydrolase [Candidatus Omnitrophota bacterium]
IVEEIFGLSGNIYHGMARYEKWNIEKIGVDKKGIYIRSSFDAKNYPEIIKNFGSAKVTIIYHLNKGQLSIETVIENNDQKIIPMSLAFHPWFNAANRSLWQVKLPVTKRWQAIDQLPTGALENVEKANFALADQAYDDVFTGLNFIDRAATTSLYSADGKLLINIIQDASFPHIVFFAPTDKEVICVEPQTSATDAFNLAERNIVRATPIILGPGQVWRGNIILGAAIRNFGQELSEHKAWQGEKHDSARPVPDQAIPTKERVNTEINRVGWDNAQTIAAEAIEVRLALNFLHSVGDDAIADYLEYLVAAGLIRAGPFEGFLAAPYQAGIALSTNYLQYNTIVERAASLIHDIGATDKFIFSHQENAFREEIFKESLLEAVGFNPGSFLRSYAYILNDAGRLQEKIENILKLEQESGIILPRRGYILVYAPETLSAYVTKIIEGQSRHVTRKVLLDAGRQISSQTSTVTNAPEVVTPSVRPLNNKKIKILSGFGHLLFNELAHKEDGRPNLWGRLIRAAVIPAKLPKESIEQENRHNKERIFWFSRICSLALGANLVWLGASYASTLIRYSEAYSGSTTGKLAMAATAGILAVAAGIIFFTGRSIKGHKHKFTVHPGFFSKIRLPHITFTSKKSVLFINLLLIATLTLNMFIGTSQYDALRATRRFVSVPMQIINNYANQSDLRISGDPENLLVGDIEHTHMSLQGMLPGVTYDLDITTVPMDNEKYELQLASQVGGVSSLRYLTYQSGAVAGINGGLTEQDPETNLWQSEGLTVSAGQTITPFDSEFAELIGGSAILFVKNDGTADVIFSDQYANFEAKYYDQRTQTWPDIRIARQLGPVTIWNGQVRTSAIESITNLEDNRSWTIYAITDRGDVLFITSAYRPPEGIDTLSSITGPSMLQVAETLAGLELSDGSHIVSALHGDGGGISQQVLETPDGQVRYGASLDGFLNDAFVVVDQQLVTEEKNVAEQAIASTKLNNAQFNVVAENLESALTQNSRLRLRQILFYMATEDPEATAAVIPYLQNHDSLLVGLAAEDLTLLIPQYSDLSAVIMDDLSAAIADPNVDIKDLVAAVNSNALLLDPATAARSMRWLGRYNPQAAIRLYNELDSDVRPLVYSEDELSMINFAIELENLTANSSYSDTDMDLFISQIKAHLQTTYDFGFIYWNNEAVYKLMSSRPEEFIAFISQLNYSPDSTYLIKYILEDARAYDSEFALQLEKGFNSVNQVAQIDPDFIPAEVFNFNLAAGKLEESEYFDGGANEFVTYDTDNVLTPGMQDTGDAILELADNSSGVTTASVFDLTSGEGFSVNGDRPIPMASTARVIIMLSVLDDAQMGHFPFGPITDSRIQAMMGPHNNDMAYLLVDLVTLDDINAKLQEWGLNDTVIQHWGDFEYAVPEDQQITDPDLAYLNSTNRTTANDMARLLKMLVSGELLSPELTTLAINYMGLEQNNQLFSAGLNEDRSNLDIFSHSVGLVPSDMDGLANELAAEIGILRTKDGRVIIVTAFNHQNSNDQASEEVIKAVGSSIGENLIPDLNLPTAPIYPALAPMIDAITVPGIESSYDWPELAGRTFITIDDGCNLEPLTAMYNTLKARNLKATIFLNTTYCPIGNPDAEIFELLQKMHQEGFDFGYHTVDHLGNDWEVLEANQGVSRDVLEADFEQYTADMRVILDDPDFTIKFVRPPFGYWFDTWQEWSKENNLINVGWNLDNEHIASSLIKHPGVYLIHASLEDAQWLESNIDEIMSVGKGLTTLSQAVEAPSNLDLFNQLKSTGWDPQDYIREEEIAKLNKLQPSVKEQVTNFIAFARYLYPDYFFVIDETYRTAEEQNQAYQNGDSQFDGYTNKSNHQLGLAVDIWMLDANEHSLMYEDAPEAYEQLGALGEDFGFTWGGNWDFFDPYHFELTTETITPAQPAAADQGTQEQLFLPVGLLFLGLANYGTRKKKTGDFSSAMQDKPARNNSPLYVSAIPVLAMAGYLFDALPGWLTLILTGIGLLLPAFMTVSQRKSSSKKTTEEPMDLEALLGPLAPYAKILSSELSALARNTAYYQRKEEEGKLDILLKQLADSTTLEDLFCLVAALSITQHKAYGYVGEYKYFTLIKEIIQKKAQALFTSESKTVLVMPLALVRILIGFLGVDRTAYISGIPDYTEAVAFDSNSDIRVWAAQLLSLTEATQEQNQSVFEALATAFAKEEETKGAEGIRAALDYFIHTASLQKTYVTAYLNEALNPRKLYKKILDDQSSRQGSNITSLLAGIKLSIFNDRRSASLLYAISKGFFGHSWETYIGKCSEYVAKKGILPLVKIQGENLTVKWLDWLWLKETIASPEAAAIIEEYAAEVHQTYCSDDWDRFDYYDRAKDKGANKNMFHRLSKMSAQELSKMSAEEWLEQLAVSLQYNRGDKITTSIRYGAIFALFFPVSLLETYPEDSAAPADASSKGKSREQVRQEIQGFGGIKAISQKFGVLTAKEVSKLYEVADADIESLLSLGVKFIRGPPALGVANHSANGLTYIIIPESATAQEVAHEIWAVLNPKSAHKDNPIVVGKGVQTPLRSMFSGALAAIKNLRASSKTWNYLLIACIILSFIPAILKAVSPEANTLVSPTWYYLGTWVYQATFMLGAASSILLLFNKVQGKITDSRDLVNRLFKLSGLLIIAYPFWNLIHQVLHLVVEYFQAGLAEGMLIWPGWESFSIIITLLCGLTYLIFKILHHRGVIATPSYKHLRSVLFITNVVSVIALMILGSTFRDISYFIDPGTLQRTAAPDTFLRTIGLYLEKTFLPIFNSKFISEPFGGINSRVLTVCDGQFFMYGTPNSFVAFPEVASGIIYFLLPNIIQCVISVYLMSRGVKKSNFGLIFTGVALLSYPLLMFIRGDGLSLATLVTTGIEHLSGNWAIFNPLRQFTINGKFIGDGRIMDSLMYAFSLSVSLSFAAFSKAVFRLFVKQGVASGNPGNNYYVQLVNKLLLGISLFGITFYSPYLLKWIPFVSEYFLNLEKLANLYYSLHIELVLAAGLMGAAAIAFYKSIKKENIVRSQPPRAHLDSSNKTIKPATLKCSLVPLVIVGALAEFGPQIMNWVKVHSIWPAVLVAAGGLIFIFAKKALAHRAIVTIKSQLFKKIIPVILILTMLLSACSSAGSQPVSTPVDPTVNLIATAQLIDEQPCAFATTSGICVQLNTIEGLPEYRLTGLGVRWNSRDIKLDNLYSYASNAQLRQTTAAAMHHYDMPARLGDAVVSRELLLRSVMPPIGDIEGVTDNMQGSRGEGTHGIAQINPETARSVIIYDQQYGNGNLSEVLATLGFSFDWNNAGTEEIILMLNNDQANIWVMSGFLGMLRDMAAQEGLNVDWNDPLFIGTLMAGYQVGPGSVKWMPVLAPNFQEIYAAMKQAGADGAQSAMEKTLKTTRKNGERLTNDEKTVLTSALDADAYFSADLAWLMRAYVIVDRDIEVFSGDGWYAIAGRNGLNQTEAANLLPVFDYFNSGTLQPGVDTFTIPVSEDWMYFDAKQPSTQSSLNNFSLTASAISSVFPVMISGFGFFAGIRPNLDINLASVSSAIMKTLAGFMGFGITLMFVFAGVFISDSKKKSAAGIFKMSHLHGLDATTASVINSVCSQNVWNHKLSVFNNRGGRLDYFALVEDASFIVDLERWEIKSQETIRIEVTGPDPSKVMQSFDSALRMVERGYLVKAGSENPNASSTNSTLKCSLVPLAAVAALAKFGPGIGAWIAANYWLALGIAIGG